MKGKILLFVALASHCWRAAALPDSVSFDLDAGASARIEFNAPVDDAHLQNPPGYFMAEPPKTHVIERVIVENTGSVPIQNPVLRIDGKPCLTITDPLDFLGIPELAPPLSLYNIWKEFRVHGTTDLEANGNPLEVLRAIGATYCEDDTKALAALATNRGIEHRSARVSGHVVAEYRSDAGWQLLDGDQNAVYLELDNQTPASVADVLADPLLVLRTRIYGRGEIWRAITGWQNAARFDREDSEPKKAVKPPPSIWQEDWAILPGERLIFDPLHAPLRVLAKSPQLQENPVLRNATHVVEFHVNAAERRKHGQILAAPFPILEIRFPEGTVKPVAKPGGEPVYQIDLPPDVPALTLVGQIARGAIPLLRTGSNLISLTASDSDGRLNVAFQVNPAAAALSLPSPPIAIAPSEFRNTAPEFEIQTEGQKIWWQISDRPDFSFVAPNLDAVRDFSGSVALDSPVDQSFLTPGRDYYFRAKVRADGVWSDWSKPARFQVLKPAQPRDVRVESLPTGEVRISWVPQPGRMHIYGSDRLDFLPRHYTPLEPIRIENNRVTEQRPNKNQLLVTAGTEASAVAPARAFYRLICEEGGALSVPSALAHLPGRKSLVLQNEHQKNDEALTGTDIASETTLPRALNRE